MTDIARRAGGEPVKPIDTQVPHPPCSAEVAVFWRQGRMDSQGTGAVTCHCGQPHLEEVAVTAKLENAPADWEAPPGTQVWRVRVQAPDEDGAAHIARKVANALGFGMNPLLQRKADK
jgi:hypothetical protein